MIKDIFNLSPNIEFELYDKPSGCYFSGGNKLIGKGTYELALFTKSKAYKCEIQLYYEGLNVGVLRVTMTMIEMPMLGGPTTIQCNTTNIIQQLPVQP
jgi:hypothetical protein